MLTTPALLQMSFRGLDLGGPDESLHFLGWDEARQMYFTYDMNEDGEFVVGAEGNWDDTTSTLTLDCSVAGPEGEEKPVATVRSTRE